MSMLSTIIETSKEAHLVLSPMPQEPMQIQEVQPLVHKDSDGLKEEYMLHLQHEEEHTLAIPSRPTPASQEDTSVAEYNMIKVDCLDPVPSRGFPMRNLAL